VDFSGRRKRMRKGENRGRCSQTIIYIQGESSSKLLLGQGNRDLERKNYQKGRKGGRSRGKTEGLLRGDREASSKKNSPWEQ